MNKLTDAFAGFGSVDTDVFGESDERFGMIEIDDIDIMDQVRTEMDGDDSTIAELGSDMKKNGVISPILVCPSDYGRFLLVAGERRVRGAKWAKLKKIPAIIRRLTVEQINAIQLSENIHRKNLTMLELAKQLEMDLSKFGHDMNLVCAAWGKSKSWISKMVQVAKAPINVKALVADGVTTDMDTIAAVAGQVKKDSKAGLSADANATSNKMIDALKVNAAKPKNDQASPRSVVSNVQREAKGKPPKAATKPKVSKEELGDPYGDSDDLKAAKKMGADSKPEKQFGNVPFSSSSTGGDKQVEINDIVADMGRYFTGLHEGISDLLKLGKASDSARGNMIERLGALVKLAQG